MQIFTAEDITNTSFKGMRIPSEERRELLQIASQLGVGEGVQISRSEWKPKAAPSLANASLNNKARIQHNIPPGARFCTRTLSDDSGWVVMRVK